MFEEAELNERPGRASAPVLGLVINTHEQQGYLARVLRAVERQLLLPGEVVLADDGSGEATRDCFAEWTQRQSFPCRHAWQPHEGFRRSRILNEAVAGMESRWVVFLDGDTVPHPRFVADHERMAAAGVFVQGHRALIEREAAAEPCTGKVLPHPPSGHPLPEGEVRVRVTIHGKVRGSVNTLWDHEPRMKPELGSAPIRVIRGQRTSAKSAVHGELPCSVNPTAPPEPGPTPVSHASARAACTLRIAEVNTLLTGGGPIGGVSPAIAWACLMGRGREC